MTDFTGTTNTAADTSLEINFNNTGNEESKEHMLI